jgi:peptidoglycan-associated lipoprotein
MALNAHRSFSAGAVLLLCALSACATKPRYAPTLPPAQHRSEAGPPVRNTAPPVASAPTGPIPGSEQDFLINASDRVYFDFDEYALRSDAVPVLAAQAAWLVRYPAVQVRVEGNCDERGTREYNFALGARRAQAVRVFLVAHGVDAGRISVISYGKERPIDNGTGEAAWAHNRNAHTALVGGVR